MSTLQVPGATLFYSTAGSGPLLLFIPGGAGSGQSYARVVAPLSASYTVVTYDRRGFSKSSLQGAQDYAHRLERDADDAAALIEHCLSEQQQEGKQQLAYVFGSSSGAIIAQTLLTRHPHLIRTLVAHEPPLLRVLDDAEDRMAETRRYYDIYRVSGPEPAMEQFMEAYLGAEEAALMKRLRGSALGAPQDPYAVGNQLYWFERELPNYPFVDPNWERLERQREKLLMATSVLAKQTPEGRAAIVIAQRIGKKEVVLPGGHVGYLTHDEEWAKVFAEALKEEGGAK